ncbi:uncharacterized protein TRIADDRAFT_60585 [Trichoplax adhaerens]|uniref:Endoplasmic reticulum junction formation protein lunapark n=1 Tax=Trichoplax adhaerens TaxID=10228 RepID=B3S8L9_TRIAD|nr:hypothetical protein TRIADDRAFT_60585 [Trichoplax adhaerens]EDV20909.1 hypothetical protein TRIADDRAFT_60585 [Trichoplax adhaerens]|eukprot:XP_002116553.1 hypothetical protein TRIADDRAFT_60585 [Trichoplax adhaerens]
MGSFIGILKKNKSSKEILEDIEEKIKNNESTKRLYDHRLKNVTFDLVAVVLPLYITSLIGYYYLYLPEQTPDKIIYSLPFAVVPFGAYGIKKFLEYWYKKAIGKSNLTLRELQDSKKKVLEEVMEKETYKTAKEILERFDPASKKLQMFNQEANNTDIRRRGNAATKAKKKPDDGANNSVVLADVALRQQQQLLYQEKIIKEQHLKLQKQNDQISQGSKLLQSKKSNDSKNTTSTSENIESSINAANETVKQAEGDDDDYLLLLPGTATDGNKEPVSYPILPKDRSMTDKIMEYFVGDGPTNRYALICSNCAGHNGMALKEEFEYTTFRCAYCRYLNPSRKRRQSAPPLNVSLSESVPTSTLASDTKNTLSTPSSKRKVIHTSTPKVKETKPPDVGPKASESTSLAAVTEESTIRNEDESSNES